MESVMLDVMYDIPTMGNVEKCLVNQDVVDESAKPVLVSKPMMPPPDC